MRPVLLPVPRNVQWRDASVDRKSFAEVRVSDECLRPEGEALARLLGGLPLRVRPEAGYALTAHVRPRARTQAPPGPPRANAPDVADGYALSLDKTGLRVAGADARGAFYGVQTLRQIADQSDGRRLPAVEIRDWPDMRLRGGMVCYHMINETTPYTAPNFDNLLALLDRFAALKLNTVLFEPEAMFPYSRHPELPCELAFTPEQIQALVERAAVNRLEIMPLVQSHGHADFILGHEQHAHLREVPHAPQQFCASKPESRRLYFEIADEVMAAFPDARYFHLGGDEVGRLGSCPACAKRVAEAGPWGVLLDHMVPLCRGVLERGFTPVIWGDYFEFSQDKVDGLPKETVIMYWNYELRPWRPWAADFFLRHGYRLIGASGVRAGGRTCFAPDYTSHIDTVFDHPNELRRTDSPLVEGMVGTDWPKGGSHACTAYGLHAHAAASWRRMSRKSFDALYDRFRFGVDGVSIPRVYKILSFPGLKAAYCERMRTFNVHTRYDFHGLPFRRRVGTYAGEENRALVLRDIAKYERGLAKARPLLEKVAARAAGGEEELEAIELALDSFEHRCRLARLVDTMVRLGRKRSRLSSERLQPLKDEVQAVCKDLRALAKRTETILRREAFPPCAKRYNELAFDPDIAAWLKERLKRLRRLAGQREEYVSNAVSARQAEVLYLETRGTPRERGRQQGEHFRRRIRSALEARRAAPRGDADAEKEARFADNVRAYLSADFPAMLEEIEGMAQGADVSFQEMLAYHNWLDLAAKVGQCSSVAFSGNALLMGKTHDICAHQRAASLIHHMTLEDGRRAISLGLAGTVWCAGGMNSDGLAFGANSTPRPLHPPSTGMFIQTALHAVLLGCATTDAAVRMLRETPWTGKGSNIVLADANGRLAAVGKAGEQSELETRQIGWLFRTNHYMTDALREACVPSHDPDKGYNPKYDSSLRRMEEFAAITRTRSYCSIEDMFEVLSHHLPRAGGTLMGSICRHAEPPGETLLAVAADISNGRFYVTGTYPCDRHFREFRV